MTANTSAIAIQSFPEISPESASPDCVSCGYPKEDVRFYLGDDGPYCARCVDHINREFYTELAKWREREYGSANRYYWPPR